MSRPPITKANPYTPKSGRFAGQTFHTERSYRDALARAKGFRNWNAQRQQSRAIASAADVAKLSKAEQKSRADVLSVISDMRRSGRSLKAELTARKKTHPTVKNPTYAAFKRHAGSALEKRGGRYYATAADTVTRSLAFLTPSGVESVDVNDSRTASDISNYWHAIDAALNLGNSDPLKRFQGRAFTDAHGITHIYLTDEATIRRLYEAGELTWDDLYLYREAA